MAWDGERRIDATVADLLELQVHLAALTALLLHKAGVATLDEFATEVSASARALPDGPVRRTLEGLARGVGSEPPPRLEVIEGGRE